MFSPLVARVKHGSSHLSGSEVQINSVEDITQAAKTYSVGPYSDAGPLPSLLDSYTVL